MAQNSFQCRDRFDIKRYPTIVFFPKNNKAGKDFIGEHEQIAYVNGINRAFGYFRQDNGKLNPRAGHSKKLDRLARGFLEADADEQQHRIDKAKTLPHGARFAAVMEEVRAHGAEWTASEHARLDAAAHHCRRAECDDVILRRNILKQFV